MAEKITAYRTRDSGIYGSKDRLYDTERECLYQEAEADKVAAYNKLVSAKEELLRSLDTYTHTNWSGVILRTPHQHDPSSARPQQHSTTRSVLTARRAGWPTSSATSGRKARP